MQCGLHVYYKVMQMCENKKQSSCRYSTDGNYKTCYYNSNVNSKSYHHIK